MVVELSYPIFLNFGMGDEGTSTHVLVEHGNAEYELEELQLTKSDKSKQRSSKTKVPGQEVKRREPAKRFHVEENQSLDVVKSFAESISANFTVLTESMTNSFQKLGENLNVMNDNIMSLVHWPEGELSEDISEQVDVNEVSEGSEKHPNDGKMLTSQLQAKQSLQVKGKELMSQLRRKEILLLLRTNFFLASKRRQMRRKQQARR